MQKLLLIIDKEHLNQPLFMKLFGQKLRSLKQVQAYILHGDNSYTDQLIENGMDAAKATERATKEINHKLVALLAENGISALGLHGYHREIVQQSIDNIIEVDSSKLKNHPDSVTLVFSHLIFDLASKSVQPAPLSTLANAIKRALNIDEILCFAVSEQVSQSFKNEPPSYIDCLNLAPKEVLNDISGIKMTTIADFDEKNLLELAVSL